jgi:ABC-2 type transport system permease protein
LRAFASVFSVHYRQFIRDRAALFFTFIFPIMFILLFGWAFSGPGIRTFDVGLCDQGSSQSAIFIAQGLDSVTTDEGKKMFEVEEGPVDEMLQSLRDGDLDAVIVVPEDMDISLSQGQPSNLQVYYDPSLASNQQTMIPILYQVIDGIDRVLQNSTPLIGMEQNSLESHQLRYIDYLVPGILGMSLMFTGLFGALPVIQQRQAHIIKRLGTTPLRRSVLVGRLVFDVQMIGNWFGFCGIVILGAFAFTSLGYLIAAFVKTEEAAGPVINVITMPMMFLSGTFFEVTSMPSFIQPVVKILPLTYLNDALRQIMVAGTPLHPMVIDIAVIGGWAAVCLAVTIRFFRWD